MKKSALESILIRQLMSSGSFNSVDRARDDMPHDIVAEDRDGAVHLISISSPPES